LNKNVIGGGDGEDKKVGDSGQRKGWKEEPNINDDAPTAPKSSSLPVANGHRGSRRIYESPAGQEKDSNGARYFCDNVDKPFTSKCKSASNACLTIGWRWV
jgi:hypothetical protein